MRLHTSNLVLAVGAGFAALAATGARAEIIELTNGHVMQGRVLDGGTTDAGLALELFDTSGVVIVKWDHIVESRRKELRLEHGIDLPEETVELIDGHRVLLASGQWAEGFAENPRETEKPLRMKTRNGVKEYDRSSLAGKVEDARIDGLLVYDVETLYQQIRDANPPETPAAHKALAQRCMNIGAFEHAKEHLLVCKENVDFMQTAEGKAVEQMLRNAEVMIKAKGAQEMKQQVVIAGHDNRWNDALKLVGDIDEKYKDDVIRKAIGYDLLLARTVKGRDQYFQRAVALDVFKVMGDLIADKAREKVPLATSTDPPKSGAAAVGTLSAARNWANKELVKLLWDRVSKDLTLNADELKKYWESRTVRSVRKANYGTGSFIVVKKAASGPKGGAGDPPKRRPPGSGSGSKGGKGNVPDKPKAADKPLSEEEWWESVGPPDRARWLTALFAETSGYFEILRADQIPCQGCGGLGFNKSTASNGEEEQHFCVQCNGIGVFKSVTFR